LGIEPHDEKLKSGQTDFLPAENGIKHKKLLFSGQYFYLWYLNEKS
jgi:hypothetical protein